MVGPTQSDRLTPSAILLRAFRVYGATCLYIHADDLRPSQNRSEVKLMDQARTSQVLLLDELPIMPSHLSDQIVSLLRRRRASGLITLATLSVMVCLLENTMRDVYADSMYFLSATPEKVWVDLELPEASRVYASPLKSSAAAPVPVSAASRSAASLEVDEDLVTPALAASASPPPAAPSEDNDRELPTPPAAVVLPRRAPEPIKRRLNDKEGAR